MTGNTHSQRLPGTQEYSAWVEITTTEVSGGQPRVGTLKAVKKEEGEVVGGLSSNLEEIWL